MYISDSVSFHIGIVQWLGILLSFICQAFESYLVPSPRLLVFFFSCVERNDPVPLGVYLSLAGRPCGAHSYPSGGSTQFQIEPTVGLNAQFLPIFKDFLSFFVCISPIFYHPTFSFRTCMFALK